MTVKFIKKAGKFKKGKTYNVFPSAEILEYINNGDAEKISNTKERIDYEVDEAEKEKKEEQ